MRKRPGLTLIEIAVALGIVAIAVVPAVNMWLAASAANQATGDYAEALVVAQLLIESKVRVIAFDDQVSASGVDAASTLAYDLQVVPLSPTLKRATATVKRPGSEEPLVRLVTLTAKEN